MKSLLHLVEFTLTALLAACAAARESISTNPSEPQPKRVTAIGGIFFKSQDPKAMRDWYSLHLGLQTEPYGTNFEWRQPGDTTKKGFTLWSPFPDKTKYFEPSTRDFMINYRVQNLDWLIEQLKKEGIPIVGNVQVEPYGKFAHILDPEGNKIELWEPNDIEYDKIVQGRTK